MTNSPVAGVGAVFDHLARTIDVAPTRDHVWQLVETLAQTRASRGSEEWRIFCAGLATHPLVAVLTADPYTRDARGKPAGYPGDARTLDYVYIREIGPQSFSDVGRRLFEVTTAVPIADAVRARAVVIADAIQQYAAHHEGPIRIASIAAGHLRELDHLSPATLQRTAVWALDQDARSIERCVERLAGVQLSAYVGSIRDTLVGRVRIPRSALVYSSGLFDYLDDRAASLLLKRMFASVDIGGAVLVPNLTPTNEEIAYMEAIMDWWMTYRTADDLARLAQSARLEDVSADTFESSNGRIAWVRLSRVS